MYKEFKLKSQEKKEKTCCSSKPQFFFFSFCFSEHFSLNGSGFAKLVKENAYFKLALMMMFKALPTTQQPLHGVA
jgi:hypothetical protein